VKALTIWQPWASFIMVGAKPYEFCSRSYLAYINHPQPGERIAIRAGARPVRREEVQARLCSDRDTTGLVPELALPLLANVAMSFKCRLLPLGAVLGTAMIGTPRNAGEIFGDRVPEDSDRGEFNWAWPLTDIEAYQPPIPAARDAGLLGVEAMRRAVGSCRHDDPKRTHPQIVARFDRETFGETAALAERKGWSFNSALRLLVEWGLMDARRSNGGSE
jgi:hypothetical protein